MPDPPRIPIMLAADLAYAGLLIPPGGSYLGNRIEGPERVIVWKLPDGTLLEQRVPRESGAKKADLEKIPLEAHQPDWPPPLRLIRGDKT